VADQELIIRGTVPRLFFPNSGTASSYLYSDDLGTLHVSQTNTPHTGQHMLIFYNGLVMVLDMPIGFLPANTPPPNPPSPPAAKQQ